MLTFRQNATVYIMLSLTGARSVIEILYDGRKEKIYPFKEETVADLKLELWKRLGIPARRQVLLYEGRALLDCKSFLSTLWRSPEFDELQFSWGSSVNQMS